MRKNLMVAVVGDRNAGKSTVWYSLFRQTVRTGDYERPLTLLDGRECNVFLINGSPQERELSVKRIIKGKPRIVLCSVQYVEEAFPTFRHFLDRDYLIYCVWLNPGYNDGIRVQKFDALGMMNYLLSQEGITSIRDGRGRAEPIASELRCFIHGWATTQKLARPIEAD